MRNRADKTTTAGRQWAFNLTVLFSSVFGLALAGANDYNTFLVLTAFVGFGVGGNVPIDTTITLECIPQVQSHLLHHPSDSALATNTRLSAPPQTPPLPLLLPTRRRRCHYSNSLRLHPKLQLRTRLQRRRLRTPLMPQHLPPLHPALLRQSQELGLAIRSLDRGRINNGRLPPPLRRLPLPGKP